VARIENLPEHEQSLLRNFAVPKYETRPWVTGPTLKNRRIAIVTTAGLHTRDDNPFSIGASDYRIIPSDVKTDDLVMSHISVNFDRSGYQEDLNTIFPIDRMRELADEGRVESLATHHYSFMGATNPQDLEPNARRLATILKADCVDSVLLTGV
jgi:D-proline reductase (dithiol) PrdB